MQCTGVINLLQVVQRGVSILEVSIIISSQNWQARVNYFIQHVYVQGHNYFICDNGTAYYVCAILLINNFIMAVRTYG